MPNAFGVTVDGIEAIGLESDLLRAVVAPSVGGRIISLIHIPTGYEFLWRNANLALKPLPPGSEYDPNFYGGIDELLPNDLPETIGGVDRPDHGELWTAQLLNAVQNDKLIVYGFLPLSKLRYQRTLSLADGSTKIQLRYRITNESDQRQPILWKLHAAMNIAPGDRILCPAKTAQVVDPEYTRWKTFTPFSWPNIDGNRADAVPEKNRTIDFLYLYDLEEGRIAWERPETGLRFEYRFDRKIFPCAWYFASYGGFLDHYTAILEPCTTMPISVNEAAQGGKCLWLNPGEELSTAVTIHAGPTQ